MDCTGEQKRIQICNEYDVTAIGCIVIFDGREVISDAGGQIITDKYYQFRCVHKINKQCDFIKCGEPTARQICNLCGIDLPSTFNPFVANGNGIGGHGGHGITWNRARKQLNNAIMLFITAKPDVMQPDKPLYKIKEQNERNKMNPINKSDVKAIDTIFGSFLHQ